MMIYKDMEKGFQHAFSAALRAYRRGSTPIGCAIMDKDDNLLCSGENSIYANNQSEVINNHNLAHAEINAILKIKSGHNAVSQNTLYTTMEPCALCFGAIVMSYYKSVKFAAYDKYGGATCLNSATDFIKNQNITVSGPFEPLQKIQIALLIFRRLELGFEHNSHFIDIYNSYCADGVLLGQHLFEDKLFAQMINHDGSDSGILNYMLSR
jgi:tRNA(adenine34) deaminase